MLREKRKEENDNESENETMRRENIASDCNLATIMLYDGSPLYNEGKTSLGMIDQENINFFGTSSKHINALNKLNLKLSIKEPCDLSSSQTIGSTGSPLSHESLNMHITMLRPMCNCHHCLVVLTCYLVLLLVIL